MGPFGRWPEERLASDESGGDRIAVQEPVIYREEVTATMIALSDIVTLLKEIKELLLDEEEEEDGG
jgi:hypothetical protein